MFETRTKYWIVAFAVLFAILWLLNEILFPFIAGIALAYLLDPIADLLERWKFPRWLAAGVLTFIMVLTVSASVLLLIPLLQSQASEIALKAPKYFGIIQGHTQELFLIFQTHFSDSNVGALKDKFANLDQSKLFDWVGRFLKGIWGGGLALLHLFSLVIITPIVLFYLLRDWDLIVKTVDSWLPRHHQNIIQKQVIEIDEVLSAFVRGQFLVCVLLGLFYATGLTILGLDFGFVVGFFTGLLSFIPYFGMLIGLIVATSIAIAQFAEWQIVGIVVGIFVFGQFVEGNFVTPKLVGEKIKLHPVWVILSLLAGGSLFGFTGILLAIPAAAVIGVFGRFGISHYKNTLAFREAKNPSDEKEEI